MLVGYKRVSSDGNRQVPAPRRNAPLAAGVDARHLFEDRASGSRDDRAGLAAALAFPRPTDCLRVYPPRGARPAMATTPTRLIERFYHEVWNEADEAVAREILHPGFRFRASLGPEKTGPEGFIEYMRLIHAALSGYTCTILDVIEQGDRAAARLRFAGLHRGTFFGVAPTGREIAWSGAAFFATDGSRITSLWVLGDVDAVKQQLDQDGRARLTP